MAELELFDFRVNPGELIPTELMKLSVEEQTEKWTQFMDDLSDYLAQFSTTQSQMAVTMLAPDTAVAYVNAPAGATPNEWAASSLWRNQVDLTKVTEARVSARCSVAGAVGALLHLQGATDDVTFGPLDDVIGPSCSLAATGTTTSGWVRVKQAFRTDLHLRLAHSGGDGAADPALGLVVAQFR